MEVKSVSMRLEELYPNFGESPPEEQAIYVAQYRLRRAKDLATIPSTKKQSAKTSKIDLSEEEKAVMKSLGISMKDIVALRDASLEEESKESDKELFNEDLNDEGDEVDG